MSAATQLNTIRVLLAFDIKGTDPKNTQTAPISATAFNHINGSTIFAYAVSYDWAHGYKGNFAGHPNKIMLHACKVRIHRPSALR